MIHLSPQTLNNFKRIALVCHTQPDGDAMGSMLGLAHVLRQHALHISCIAPDPPPFFLDFMPGLADVIIAETNPDTATKTLNEAELLICLDHSRPDRTGKLVFDWICAHPELPLFMIDHHPDPDLNAYVFSIHDTSASSTCELVVRQLKDFNISPEAADCFMTGLITDTGGFRHAVNEQTFLIAARLQQAGSRYIHVLSQIFDQQSPERLRLLGYLLYQKMQLHFGGRVALMALGNEELRRFNARKGDTEGMVNHPLSVKGVEIAILLTEREKGITRISFRSKGEVSVNDFAAQYFAGGGHKNAAGGRYDGTAAEAFEKILQLLPEFYAAFTE